MLGLFMEKVLNLFWNRAGDKITGATIRKIEDFVERNKKLIFVVNIKVPNAFFQRFCHQFISSCIQHGHFNIEMITINSDSKSQFNQKLEQLGDVYGAIIIPTFIEPAHVKELLNWLRNNKIPSVVVGKLSQELSGYSNEFGEAYYDVEEAAKRMAAVVKGIGGFGSDSCCIYLSQKEEGSGIYDDASSNRRRLYPMESTSEKRRACIPEVISPIYGNCGVLHSALKAHRIANIWLSQKILEENTSNPMIIACANEEIAVGAAMAINSLAENIESASRRFLFMSFDYVDIEAMSLPRNAIGIFAIQDPEKLADEVYARFRNLRSKGDLKGPPMNFRIETIGLPQLVLTEAQ